MEKLWGPATHGPKHKTHIISENLSFGPLQALNQQVLFCSIFIILRLVYPSKMIQNVSHIVLCEMVLFLPQLGFLRVIVHQVIHSFYKNNSIRT